MMVGLRLTDGHGRMRTLLLKKLFGAGFLLHAGLFLMFGVALAAAPVQAAETLDPTPMMRTTIALKLGAEGNIPFESKKDDKQNAVFIRFPAGRVTGSLPEQSVVDAGVIRQIETRYYSSFGRGGERYIREIRIALAGDYRTRIRTESGRVMVEIEHPVSVGGSAFEFGLRGGLEIASMGRPVTLARFRAMQQAMQTVSQTGQAPSRREQEKPLVPFAGSAAPSAATVTIPSITLSRKPVSTLPFVFGMLAAAGVMLAGLGLLTWFSWKMSQRLGAAAPEALKIEPGGSGIALIDELVWRSFERQGYALAGLQDLPDSSTQLRVLEKDGSRAGLWCVGSGSFFEKQTVDRFAEILKAAQLDEGFLAATGSFTVPAQRAARDQRITLIGREQLVGLLGIGAAGEYVQVQLEQSKSDLDEAKRMLRRHEDELETLRRQRNEASWHLGSERVKASTLESQLGQMTTQIDQYKADLEKWESEAVALKKQWEESQWYLGESRSRERFVESQIAVLQAGVAQVGNLSKERDEAHSVLVQEKAARQSLEAELAGLRLAKAEAERREQELAATVQRYKQELHAVRFYGERRSATRSWVPDAFVELLRDQDALYSGAPLDLSGSGMRLQMSSSAGQGEVSAGTDGAFAVRLHLPGLSEPAVVRAERVWEQEQSGTEASSGYRFVGLNDGVKAHLEHLVANGALPLS